MKMMVGRGLLVGMVLVLGSLVVYYHVEPKTVVQVTEIPLEGQMEEDLLLIRELLCWGNLSKTEEELVYSLKISKIYLKSWRLDKTVEGNSSLNHVPNPQSVVNKAALNCSKSRTTSPIPREKYGSQSSISKPLKRKPIFAQYFKPPVIDISPEAWASQQLKEGLVQNKIHFVWCGEGLYFMFQHYLSVIAAFRTLQPDNIYFHYEFLPVVDKLYYFQWLDNLKRDLSFFEMMPLYTNQTSICTGSKTDRLRQILELLRKEGGIYIGINTWLLNYPPDRRLQDVEISLDLANEQGFLMLRGGLLDESLNLEKLLNTSIVKFSRSSCSSVRHLHLMEGYPDCLIAQGGYVDGFYPMDIWELDEKFGRIARTIFYGSPEILRPEPKFDELVPNIAHMVWIGGGEMDFVFYLSVLSLLYVVEVENVFIHGDLPPAGPYWEKISQNEHVHFITRPIPTLVFQGQIEDYYRALMSDIIRVDLMIKFGGIYTDTDAIWVKPLSKVDRGYEAVASFDWVDWSLPYPDTVNFGVSYGKRNAPFWHIFQETMHTLHNHVHGFTGVMMPYKLLELYPHLLRIDRHLSVICYEFKCHPTWVKGYHDINNNHVTKNSIPNWREDVYAFHWTYPSPTEYADQETLLNSTGMFAEIGQFVLKKAGLA